MCNRVTVWLRRSWFKCCSCFGRNLLASPPHTLFPEEKSSRHHRSQPQLLQQGDKHDRKLAPHPGLARPGLLVHGGGYVLFREVTAVSVEFATSDASRRRQTGGAVCQKKTNWCFSWHLFTKLQHPKAPPYRIKISFSNVKEYVHNIRTALCAALPCCCFDCAQAAGALPPHRRKWCVCLPCLLERERRIGHGSDTTAEVVTETG